MINQLAYIIHQREHNEQTKFAVIMTREHGICSSPTPAKKRFNFFVPYQATRKNKRMCLHDPVSAPYPLLGKKLYCGLYLNELIYKSCKSGDSHPNIFDHYSTSLEALRNNEPFEHILRKFELTVIDACGYALCAKHITEPFTVFNSNEGLIGTHQPNKRSIDTVSLNHMLINQQPSPEVKVFFQYILKQILSSSLQSRLFYENAI